ncbi:TetR/AcrR family transcriptional regulator [Pseudomonas veronii]|uniref:TetR/AcrR family transcriptional regulator n=1 Tax=Pseudomonas veronii TaxID=76761 RepID=A0A5M8EQW0_PSEVE|nr:TetR/AcrR family transcriptional regulator [Pseudomonas veronii]KAA6171522.1 TetR/AcrR family transcriptional regulator [Pseudomonas veronii]KAA6178270.1 TetR/AcrR family transcriptional regulator [Pseudomonas veronii]
MRVKTEAKREAILAAACEIFREAGFEGASMADIALRIGGSKATLYGYFGSKEELFIAAMQDEAVKEFDPILATFDREVSDIRKTLQVCGEKVLEFLCSANRIQTLRAIIAQSGRTDIGKRFHESGPQIGLARIAEFLDRQMTLGRLRRSDPLSAAVQLKALLECETVAPLLLGIEEKLTKPQIKVAVERAVNTFLAAYAVDREQSN